MLLKEIISPNPSASIIVSFGVNPYKRHEFLMNLQSIENITVFATVREQDGMEILKTKKVDVVVIGTMYAADARKRVVEYVIKNMPSTKLLQPGIDFEADMQVLKMKIEENI